MSRVSCCPTDCCAGRACCRLIRRVFRHQSGPGFQHRHQHRHQYQLPGPWRPDHDEPFRPDDRPDGAELRFRRHHRGRSVAGGQQSDHFAGEPVRLAPRHVHSWRGWSAGNCGRSLRPTQPHHCISSPRRASAIVSASASIVRVMLRHLPAMAEFGAAAAKQEKFVASMLEHPCPTRFSSEYHVQPSGSPWPNGDCSWM